MDLPQLTEDQPGASAARRRPRRSLAGRDGGVPQPRRGRLRAADHVRQPRPDRDAGRRTSIRARRRASTSAMRWSSICLPARSRASPTSTLFGGANALAVESAPGVWEIAAGRASAELIAPGRYRLTRLLRGQRGTEGAMGNPAPAGARVVVLDDALASLPIAEAELGLPWNWRIGPASRPVSDETYVAQSLHARGRRAAAVLGRPCRAAVAHGARARRSDDPLDAPVARARGRQLGRGSRCRSPRRLEAYEVEILDGATVKRMLSTATTSAVYTAAQQTADWGALLGPGDTLDVRIFQLSALVGRGAPKTVTLTVLKAIPCPTPDPSPAALPPGEPGPEARHPQRGAAAARRAGAARRARPRPDSAARKPRRRRPLHRRPRARPATGPAGTERRLLGRRRLDAPRRRGPAGGRGSRTRACCWSSTARAGPGPLPAALQNLCAARARHHGGCVEPVLGQAQRRALDREDRGRGRDRRSVLHHEQGGRRRRSRADAADRLRDQGAARALRLGQLPPRGLGRRQHLLRRAERRQRQRHRRPAAAAAVQGLHQLRQLRAASATWTKIGINNTDYNDQGAFDAANNHFVAPVDGTYLFGATLLYKINASATARMRGRLVLNGTTEIHGSLGEISATHVSLATAIWLQTMVPLTRGRHRRAAGVFPGRGRLLRRRPHVLLGLQDRLSGGRRIR